MLQWGFQLDIIMPRKPRFFVAGVASHIRLLGSVPFLVNSPNPKPLDC